MSHDTEGESSAGEAPAHGPSADAGGQDQGVAVLAVNARFYAAFNAKDFAAMDALWARATPVACIHPGWNALEGRDAVMESWQRILENPQQPKIVSGAEAATVVGEAAVVVGRGLVAGSPIATTNGFVLEEGEWRIFLHHASSVAALD
ncbi:MAG TPA: nuclear transport factor 2 family protein [Dehalococcoidia bacterium]|nr:nuclear transport factor 2 family protein [Dehalococcoidia bacterium]